MINSLCIKNLKSIKDSGIIELKPLNVLIGKNSSGKSSLLRVFPLMKQSYELNLSDPILWYGKYVDFGSFNNSINSTCDKTKDSIQMTFDLTLSMDTFRARRLFKKDKHIVLSLFIKEHSIDKYLIKIDNANLIELIHSDNDLYSLYLDKKIIEKDSFTLHAYEKNKFPTKKNTLNEDNSLYRFDDEGDAILSKYFSKGDKRQLFSLSSYELPLSSKIIFTKVVEESINLIRTLTKTTKQIELADAESIAKILIKNAVDTLLILINNHLSSIFLNSEYYEPLRARGDRFYRIQGLSVDGIDSNGDNSAMYLFSMSETEKCKFEKWSMENFGFVYKTNSSFYGSESTSVIVKTNDNVEHNLTDVGFGYSQIFPIILSLWNDTKKSVRVQKIITIEQPELHLHPSFQQKIIKAIFQIIKLYKQNGSNICFIIETHSESIVNYLGRQARNKENENIINLLVCNKNNGQSSFEKMIFDNDGLITNWPIGFFSDNE